MSKSFNKIFSILHIVDKICIYLSNLDIMNLRQTNKILYNNTAFYENHIQNFIEYYILKKKQLSAIPIYIPITSLFSGKNDNEILSLTMIKRDKAFYPYKKFLYSFSQYIINNCEHIKNHYNTHYNFNHSLDFVLDLMNLNPECIPILIKYKWIKNDIYDNIMMCHLARYGYLNNIKEIISNQSNDDLLDSDYNNVFIEACKYGHIEIVKYLIEKNEELKKKNNR